MGFAWGSRRQWRIEAGGAVGIVAGLSVTSGTVRPAGIAVASGVRPNIGTIVPISVCRLAPIQPIFRRRIGSAAGGKNTDDREQRRPGPKKSAAALVAFHREDLVLWRRVYQITWQRSKQARRCQVLAFANCRPPGLAWSQMAAVAHSTKRSRAIRTGQGSVHFGGGRGIQACAATCTASWI